MTCEHCGCGTDHTRPSMKDTETTCHCGTPYNGSDHCPACGCEQYESLACFGIRDFDTSPRYDHPYTMTAATRATAHSATLPTAASSLAGPARTPTS